MLSGLFFLQRFVLAFTVESALCSAPLTFDMTNIPVSMFFLLFVLYVLVSVARTVITD